MQEFQEATINPAPTAPQDQTFQITTDDLVFIIGEKAIGERQSNKLIAALQQNLNYLQQELMKLQSVGANEHNELEAMRQRAEAAEQQVNAASSQAQSWQSRITALENQVYQTAQERDQAIKERAAMEERTNQLEAIIAGRDQAIKERAAMEERTNQLEAIIAGVRDEREAALQSIIDLKSELVALKSLSAASQDGGEWSAQEPAKPAKRGKK